MLAVEVDIAALSDQELQRLIEDSCRPYGTVVRTRVHVNRVNLRSSQPCAIVDMETAEQATSIADAFLATSIGKSVVILLLPKPRSGNQLILSQSARENSPGERSTPEPANQLGPNPRPKTMFQLLVQYENRTPHE